MSVFKSSKTKHLSRADALNCIPVKNPEVRAESLTDGHVILRYPIRMYPFWRKIFRSPDKKKASSVYTRKLQLDTLGAAVWDQIDGHHSVRTLVEWFATAYQFHPSEAEKGVTRFLRDLGKRGLIGLK